MRRDKHYLSNMCPSYPVCAMLWVYLYSRGEELRELWSGCLFSHTADDLNALLNDVIAIAVVHTA